MEKEQVKTERCEPEAEGKRSYAAPRILESGSFEHLILGCSQQFGPCGFTEEEGINS